MTFFFDGDNQKQDIIQKFTSATQESFDKLMIKDYLYSIKNNADANQKKVKEIENAQKSFYLALIMVPLFALVIIIAKFVPGWIVS